MLPKVFEKAVSNDNTPKVFLALEGGASHGAFTWGVLEVLEQHGILNNVTAISGTSAGANNAVAVAAGLAQKKAGGVSRVTSKLWEGIGQKGDSLKHIADMYRTFSMTKWPNLPMRFKTDAELANQTGSMTGLKSQSGHVRDHIADVIKDWSAIKESPIKVFVGATRVEYDDKGRKVLIEENFSNPDIDADAVGASGCLFGTHKKNGKEYKDGAYTKNPPMADMLKDKEYSDLFAIMLSPEPHAIIPKHQDTLVAEDADGLLGSETYSHLAHEAQRGRNVHVISMQLPEGINESSKMTFDSKWVQTLREMGRHAALEWIHNHKHDLGQRSSYKPNITQATPNADLQNIPEVA